MLNCINSITLKDLGNMSFTRRKFLKNVGVTAVAVPFVSAPLSGRKLKSSDDLLDIHLFSKHLQFLD